MNALKSKRKKKSPPVCEPEFVRIPVLESMFGIKRGNAYAWINSGIFKSILLQHPKNRFGVRLVNVRSVREFLENQLKAQQKTPLKVRQCQSPKEGVKNEIP